MKDEVLPEHKWAFDENVTEVFDDMLKRSIPQYDVMRQLCFSLGSKFVKIATDIVDIGCSRGEALGPFIERFGIYNRFIGCDVSAPMLEAARERFRSLIDLKIVDIRECDLRTNFPACHASLILSVLTIQFTPIEYRQKIIQKVFQHLAPGGAFVFVEKVLGESAETDSLFVDEYLEMKKSNGYTEEQILRKRLSLEGVLVPVTARWNAELLRSGGFTVVEQFWRYLNFTAFLAVKS